MSENNSANKQTVRYKKHLILGAQKEIWTPLIPFLAKTKTVITASCDDFC